jgi:hypothetical protein
VLMRTKVPNVILATVTSFFLLALLRSEEFLLHTSPRPRWPILLIPYIFVSVSMNRLAISPTSAGPTAELDPRP